MAVAAQKTVVGHDLQHRKDSRHFVPDRSGERPRRNHTLALGVVRQVDSTSRGRPRVVALYQSIYPKMTGLYSTFYYANAGLFAGL